MNTFDMFYYLIYSFLNNKLKRGKDNAKFSALSILSLYLGFFTVLIINIIGLIVDNPITKRVVSLGNNSFFVAIFIAFISLVFWGYRYYKVLDIEDIEKKIDNISKTQRICYKSLTVVWLISIPILSYIFGRLYMFGHI